MRPLILLAAFLLSGCWEGAGLYAEVDASSALPTGAYELLAKGEEPEAVRVLSSATGMTHIEIRDEEDLVGFVPLDGEGRTFVHWTATDDGNQLFDLAIRERNGDLVVYMPSCEDEQAEIARSSGALIEQGTVPTCRFTSRASLEQAMRRFRPAADQEVYRLVPLRSH